MQIANGVNIYVCKSVKYGYIRRINYRM